jgi:serine protease
VYVYLLRKESVTSFSSSYEIVQSVFFERILGSASFSFDNIPAGNYFLEASTDNDGDRRLFDPGEALGAYRLSNSESYLSLRSDRDGLRFSMQYQDLSETNEYAHSFDPQIDRALP